MKKTLTANILFLTLICVLFSFTACKKEISSVKVDNIYLGTSDESLKVDGMSAFALFTEAYANWLEDDAYLREETLNFSVESSLGVMGNRTMQSTRKIDGDRIRNFEITLGDGVISNMTMAKIYYFDGKDAYQVSTSDRKVLNFDGDRYKVEKWGDFAPFDGDVQSENAFLADRWTVYDLSKRESLAGSHNDSVYKAGDTYYFTLTVDCSTDALKKHQPTVLSEYTANMSAPQDTYKMENTRIDVAVREIDGKLKFVEWYRSEIYSGKARDIMQMTCRETCYNKLSYTGYQITDDELLNLA